MNDTAGWNAQQCLSTLKIPREESSNDSLPSTGRERIVRFQEKYVACCRESNLKKYRSNTIYSVEVIRIQIAL